jgi:hypothetical protein
MSMDTDICTDLKAGRNFGKQPNMNAAPNKSLAQKWFILLAAIAVIVPLSANGQKSKDERGLIEKMEAVPCGASEKGLSGLGALWGSAGITHLSTNEKLCPQYLFRTDQMDYEIRPLDLKHATLLPVGKEGEFQIKKNRMLLRFPDTADHKTRAYEIVQMDPAQTDTDAATSSSPGDDQSTSASSTETGSDDR